MSEHGPPNPQLLSTPITSPSAAAAIEELEESFAARPAFVTVDMLTRHILAITLCGALASVSVAFKKARKAEHVPFASRARQLHEVPMLLCVCSCVTLPSQDDLPQCLRLLPRAARDGLALCHLSRQDTSRGVPSQDRHRSKLCAYRR